jgi:hypothetical protein
MKLKRPSLVILPILAVLLGVAALNVGRWTGADAGQRSLDRLQLVWPSLLAMPEQDRALLAGLAMTCRLEQRDKEPKEVIGCLREAVNDDNPILPRDMDKELAAQGLERLLAHRE